MAEGNPFDELDAKARSVIDTLLHHDIVEMSVRRKIAMIAAAFTRKELAAAQASERERAAKECDEEANAAAETIRRQEMAGEHGGKAREQTIGWEQGARRCSSRIRSLSPTQEKPE